MALVVKELHHEYEVAPPAVKVAVSLLQIIPLSAFSVTAGTGFTVKLLVTAAVQPLAEVAETR